jgi:esterase/lipase superfamily enzyme
MCAKSPMERRFLLNSLLLLGIVWLNRQPSFGQLPPNIAQVMPRIQPENATSRDVKISGFVVGPERDPVVGAVIGVARWDAKVWQPITTSSADGHFESVVRLQPGSYVVYASMGGLTVTKALINIASPLSQAIDRSVIEISVTLKASFSEAQADEAPLHVPPSDVLPEGTFYTASAGSSTSPSQAAPPSPAAQVPNAPVIATPPRFGTIRLPSLGARTSNPGKRQEMVNVFYATNRPLVDGRPGNYREPGQLPSVLTYGVCRVSIPPTHQPGTFERPAIWKIQNVENTNDHLVITDRREFKDDVAFRSELHTAMGQSKSEAFLFVHGYNVTFDDAVRRTAQLFRDLKFDGVPILFSWPAQNAWWKYPAAEDTVGASAHLLRIFLNELLANEDVSAVNVIAHSMGARILMDALERLTVPMPGENQIDKLAVSQKLHSRPFRNIVLAAPDINVANLDAMSILLKWSASRATLYSSSTDVALVASKVFHTYPRLGEAPPDRIVDGIDTVDASAIRRDFLGHSYFGDSSTLIRDLFLLLKQGLDPAARYLQPHPLGMFQYWVVPKE